MKGKQNQAQGRDNAVRHAVHLVRGLPMFAASAPQILAKEKADLAELESKGILRPGGGGIPPKQARAGFRVPWCSAAEVLWPRFLPGPSFSTNCFGSSRWQWP